MEPHSGLPSSELLDLGDLFTLDPESGSGLPSSYGDFFAQLHGPPPTPSRPSECSHQDDQRIFRELVCMNGTSMVTRAPLSLLGGPIPPHDRENSAPPWGLATPLSIRSTQVSGGPALRSDSLETHHLALPKRNLPHINSSQPKRRKTIDTPARATGQHSKQEKLDQFFDLLDELKWTLGELLHHLFVWRYSPSETIAFSCRHGAHIVKDRLLSEAWNAVKSSTGLYTPLRRDNRAKNLHWNDLSASLTATATAKFKKHQPLAFHYMASIAQGLRKRNGVIAVRSCRLVDVVVAHALAALDFCRSSNARLIPISRGILYLASTVPTDVIAYNSHVGNMPSINTLKVALKVFSDKKADVIRSLGHDSAVQKELATGEEFVYINHILFDNVQHFLKQRDQWIRRENSMVIGIAATYICLKASPRVCDLGERQQILDLKKREQLTVDQLISLIDQSLLRQIGVLQWLGALAKFIPELAHMQAEISLRYHTRCRKLVMETEETQMYPLACSGKNEAVISELKDAFVDFLGQLNQHSDDHDNRLWLAGGDGMSFNNLHILKWHLQADPNAFQSFENMIPVLQPWHTMWTDLNRIYTTHWGGLLDDNPSTLAYSAKKIGRPPPGNLKKVDYYPSEELLDLVHDMRMLDCWWSVVQAHCILAAYVDARTFFNTKDIFAYFADLCKKGSLPSFEALEGIADKLFCSYSTSAAYHQCVSDARSEQSPWSATIPEGRQWIPPLAEDLTYIPPQSSQKKSRGQKPNPSKNGDITLSESIAFMQDAMVAREAVYAVAEGDVRRLWEAMKAMVLTFAGTSHGKYTGYLLETICTLKLESSKELRELILRSMVINLSGQPGHWQAGDIIQELLNRCLEPIIQRNDIQFGSDYIRNHWAQNILDVYKLKQDLCDSVGLSRHPGKHTKPHEKPEVKILLKEYANLELHSWQPGRIYSALRDVDDMARGIDTLSKGGLSKWVKRTTQSHGLREGQAAIDMHNDGEDVESEGRDSDSESLYDENEASQESTDGALTMVGLIHLRDRVVCFELLEDIGDPYDEDDEGVEEDGSVVTTDLATDLGFSGDVFHNLSA
ncbi:hypothetical protein BDN71DRAFT_1577613 [Pleurotus eryngii]|uniref:DUF6589 domain-containing protein n=1 Tax=Pleurotus eryngii TaxID=5323 RepID=A0A9P6AAD9_PLEER|nr:hypothetical protein BDN71DRAFT_1577613 [Pleurotus eryngii]